MNLSLKKSLLDEGETENPSASLNLNSREQLFRDEIVVRVGDDSL